MQRFTGFCVAVTVYVMSFSYQESIRNLERGHRVSGGWLSRMFFGYNSRTDIYIERLVGFLTTLFHPPFRSLLTMWWCCLARYKHALCYRHILSLRCAPTDTCGKPLTRFSLKPQWRVKGQGSSSSPSVHPEVCALA